MAIEEYAKLKRVCRFESAVIEASWNSRIAYTVTRVEVEAIRI